MLGPNVCTAATAAAVVIALCGPSCFVAMAQAVSVTGIDVRRNGIDARTGLPRVEVSARTPSNALNRSEPFCFDGFGIWAARAVCRAAGYATAGSVIEADAIGSAVPLNWWVDCPTNASTFSADVCAFRVRSNDSCVTYRANVICNVEDAFAFEWCPVVSAPAPTTTSAPTATATASNATTPPPPPPNVTALPDACSEGFVQMRPNHHGSRVSHAEVRAFVCGDTVGYNEARALCKAVGFEFPSLAWYTRGVPDDDSTTTMVWPDGIDCNPRSTRNVLDDCRVWAYSSRLGGAGRCRSLKSLNCRHDYARRGTESSHTLSISLIVVIFISLLATGGMYWSVELARRYARRQAAAIARENAPAPLELALVDGDDEADRQDATETADATDTGPLPPGPDAVPNPLDDPEL